MGNDQLKEERDRAVDKLIEREIQHLKTLRRERHWRLRVEAPTILIYAVLGASVALNVLFILLLLL